MGAPSALARDCNPEHITVDPAWTCFAVRDVRRARSGRRRAQTVVRERRLADGGFGPGYDKVICGTPSRTIHSRSDSYRCSAPPIDT